MSPSKYEEKTPKDKFILRLVKRLVIMKRIINLGFLSIKNKRTVNSKTRLTKAIKISGIIKINS